jgi:hypothetical protein
MMENALIENLIAIKIGCAAANLAPQDGQSAPFTFRFIENALENLMISKAKIRRVGTAQDDDIL